MNTKIGKRRRLLLEQESCVGKREANARTPNMLFQAKDGKRRSYRRTGVAIAADAKPPSGLKRDGSGGGGLLLVDRVQVAPDQLVHLEHVDLGLLEHGRHLVVAEDLALVLWVLELVALDVFPELLDDLRAGELVTASATAFTQNPSARIPPPGGNPPV